MALIDKLNNLGDAVRERSGVTEKMTLEQMAQQVKDIPYPVVDEITITENGKYTAPSGIDGYSEVVVDIPEVVCPVPIVEGITITENGTYTPNEGVDGFNEVVVDIPEVVCPECPEPVIEGLAITANGTYTVPTGIDGFNPVSVNIPETVCPEPVLRDLVVNVNGVFNPSDGIDGFSMVTVNVPTGGGGGIEVEPIVLTGDQENGCAGAMANKYIELFGDTVSTSDITEASYMFNGYAGKRIPFDINFSTNASYHDVSHMFDSCVNLEELPKLNNVKPYSTSSLFTTCTKLKYIPDDYGAEWDWSYLNTSTRSCSGLFWYCYNLRKAPKVLIKNNYSLSTSTSSTPYRYLFSSCITLEEVDGLVVVPATLTSNAMSSMFEGNYRLSHFTFETNEDGTPKTANWKNQNISFIYTGGFSSIYDSSIDKVLCDDTDITKDKMVIDDATYQALKNDPDWFAANVAYWRYNHDSAVATINSLPDTSAYLAANGGTNTIKFLGNAGSGTDGGAINTLTEEEIAVAASKGWTVSLS